VLSFSPVFQLGALIIMLITVTRYKQHMSSCNYHQTPLLNIRIDRGVYNQAVTPSITRPLHAIDYTSTFVGGYDIFS